MCVQVLRFLFWFQTTSQISTDLQEDDLANIAAAFSLQSPSSNKDLLQQLERSLTEFEAHVNNVADGSSPNLSMQGAPIGLLIESAKRLGVFADKLLLFLNRRVREPRRLPTAIDEHTHQTFRGTLFLQKSASENSAGEYAPPYPGTSPSAALLTTLG